MRKRARQPWEDTVDQTPTSCRSQIAMAIMDSDSETTLQISQGRRRLPFDFLNPASRSSSYTSSAESTSFDSGLRFSFFQSPVQNPHLEMYASPPPLMRSLNYQKLSPALAASPHLFTPPLPSRGALTPGLSPIDRSPRPPRPVHTLVRAPPRRPFLEKLLNITDDSDDDGFASEIDEDESSPPPSSIHLGCTSTPPRATPRPSSSPFSSPLSTSSSLDVPLSCMPAPLRQTGPSQTGERQRSGTPPFIVTLKRPTAVGPLTHRENKRLKTAAPESSSPSPVHSPLRTFPCSIPIHPEFTGFYIRFPIVPPVLKAYLLRLCCLSSFVSHFLSPSGCTLNPPRDVFDLYTPRLVRGSGHTKVGLCPLCACTGMGRVWLSMKFSAYKWCVHYCLMVFSHSYRSQSVFPFPMNPFKSHPLPWRAHDSYHMQYFHGMSRLAQSLIPRQGVHGFRYCGIHCAPVLPADGLPHNSTPTAR